MAKFGVVLLSEVLANDLRNSNAPISAHVLCPMTTNTNFGTNRIHAEGEAERGRSESGMAAFGGGTADAYRKFGQSPDELAEHLITQATTGNPVGENAHFYILGSDSIINPQMFAVTIGQRTGDILEDRPPMSQTVEPFKQDFLQRIRAVRAKTMPKKSKL